MGAGTKVIKYLMFFFNLLIFLAGAALLGIGIYLAVAGESFKIVSGAPNAFYAVYIIIAVGGALFLLGFLGCCGAVAENKCLLGMFFALVLIFFLLEIAGAVLAVVMKSDIEEKIEESIKNYGKDQVIRESWDDIQSLLSCCGVKGPSDWEKNNVAIPNSCCSGNTSCTKTDKNVVFAEGCEAKIMNLFWIIIGLAFGILLIELLAMIFSCCLYSRVGESSY